jgi:hypothetical protein
MRVLGLDPSLTNFGYALHDTEASGISRCVLRGRFQTPAKMTFIERYITQRGRLRGLIQRCQPDAVGIEYPVFDNLYSEGMYGLFLYVSEALLLERKDVVFFSPGQIKAQARLRIKRPPKWKMDKPDMVEAAKTDTGGTGTWNHNEADAYWVAVVAGRFWLLQRGLITEADLIPLELQQFLKEHTFTRGKKAGRTVQSGIAYREDERFFLWSEIQNGNTPLKEGSP